MKSLLVLGIETSCDETAAAVVERRPDGTAFVRSDIVLSQTDEHALFGGVVPEIAARAHVESLDRVIAKALADAGIGIDAVDAIAATAGPGLIGGVLVGLTTAKAMALATGKPVIAINHLEGHALTARLTDNLPFPYLLLLVSGGHTQFVAVEGVGKYHRIGTTIDDALGEAFDKVAKLLGLPYPGGPAVERAAAAGNATRFDFPRPLIDRPGADFSLSGLKTAVRLAAEAIAPVSDADVVDICAGFQAAVVDVIANRARNAIHTFRSDHPTGDHIVVAGGVAANQAIRTRLAKVAENEGFHLLAPPLRLCTDNAAMIAWAGAERLSQGPVNNMEFAARPRWPLDAEAPAKLGSGAKGARA